MERERSRPWSATDTETKGVITHVGVVGDAIALGACGGLGQRTKPRDERDDRCERPAAQRGPIRTVVLHVAEVGAMLCRLVPRAATRRGGSVAWEQLLLRDQMGKIAHAPRTYEQPSDCATAAAAAAHSAAAILSGGAMSIAATVVKLASRRSFRVVVISATSLPAQVVLWVGGGDMRCGG